MDDKFKNLGFRDFVSVDYTQEDDDLIAYQAKKRHRGVVGESMDPRDHTDKPGHLVVVTKPSGKKMIKHYHPTSQGAQKYADRINKTNKVGHKATVHRTDGRKIMEEVKETAGIEFGPRPNAKKPVKVHTSDGKTKVRMQPAHHGADQKESVEVDEALSVSQRRKASQRMKRMSKRIQVAKKRALKRAPTADVLQKRAQKQAKNQMIKKWSRGMDKSDMSPARKAEMEKKLKKAKPRIDRMAKKLVPQLRKMDRERRSGAGKKEDK